MNAVPAPRVSIEDLESGAIDPAEFDHEAHLYLGWLYLDRFETVDAIRRFSAALKALTIRLGIPDKYHETITWFYLLLIAERRASRGPQDWFDFRRNNADLFGRGERSLLPRYYRRATLLSPLARRQFVLPDRLRDTD